MPRRRRRVADFVYSPDPQTSRVANQHAAAFLLGNAQRADLIAMPSSRHTARTRYRVGVLVCGRTELRTSLQYSGLPSKSTEQISLSFLESFDSRTIKSRATAGSMLIVPSGTV